MQFVALVADVADKPEEGHTVLLDHGSEAFSCKLLIYIEGGKEGRLLVPSAR